MLKLVGILFITIGLIALWGNRIEPRWLEVTDHEIQIKNLKASWIGSEIAFLSDFQVGMWLGNESAITKAVDKILERKPKAVLIGGDFIYHPTDDDKDDAKDDWQKDDKVRTEKLIDTVITILKPLPANGIKVLAVLGNHDYSMGTHSARMVNESAEFLTKRLETVGIKVLHNQSVKLTIRDQDLHIVGVAPFYPKMSDLDKALSNVGDNPRILFMHNANSLKDTSAAKIQFAMAGHTHGGQIAYPWFSKLELDFACTAKP